MITVKDVWRGAMPDGTFEPRQVAFEFQEMRLAVGLVTALLLLEPGYLEPRGVSLSLALIEISGGANNLDLGQRGLSFRDEGRRQIRQQA